MQRAARAAGRGAIYIVLTAGAALMLVPMVWLLAASLKGPDDLFHYIFFSPRISWVNFDDLFGSIPFLRYLMNSVFVAGATVMTQLFFSSLGGFALAKYEFAGKRAIMILMLATMMIPGQVMIAPLYEEIYRFGLVDSYLGLIVPGAVSVFGMFLFRQSMMQIPDELLHAARVDGCGEFRIYWDIVIPVSRPMIGAFCLISFMGAWNNFLWPQIILHNDQRFTLPIALNQMVGLYSQQYGTLMAGTLLSVLPVILLFFLLQKEFIAGLTLGAVKG
ncbi:MAG: carbohydrate ABC transporter permease [Armatimonadetes bacterium]|nr:carbohydrate ABC transporter permease [Armatimonadota bacterium]